MSQTFLGAELLSQAFDSAPVKPSSADPQKEPILVEVTDASTMAKNVSFSFRFILDACWSIFLKNSWFYLIFIFHLISCYVRYFLRKHLCKSRSLTVSLLKIILLLLISKPSIPQSSIQQMVRKSYAELISPQWTWIKTLPRYCRHQRWKLRANSIKCYWCIISCSPSSDGGYYREGTVSSSPSTLW